MSWIDEFLLATDAAETPRIWLKWGAICSISAVAAPNFSLNRGGQYRVKPNLYVLLIGPSGLGKAHAINTSKAIVNLVHTTRIISGRSTIEGIIKELATSKANENGTVSIKDARGYIISGEFAASLHKNTQALDILTDIYDNPPEWINTLKNSPTDRLRNPCLSVFSGANQDMFNEAIPRVHMYGGFIGRTMLVLAHKKFKYDPLTETTSKPIDYEGLSLHLKEIAAHKGEFQYSQDGKDLFEAFYLQLQDKGSDDKTGTVNRLHDHVLKVAMCLSLARDLNLILEEEDISEAIELCTTSGSAIKSVVSGKGESAISAHLKSFLVIICKSPTLSMTRRDVLSRSFHDMDSFELDRVVEFLNQAGMLSQNGDKEIKYSITDAGKAWLNKMGTN